MKFVGGSAELAGEIGVGRGTRDPRWWPGWDGGCSQQHFQCGTQGRLGLREVLRQPQQRRGLRAGAD